jgi:tRNA A37 methylthiotransferase MiaB
MHRTCIERLNKFRNIVLPIVTIYGKPVSRVCRRASSSTHSLALHETRWSHEKIPTLKEFMRRQLDEPTSSSHVSSSEAEIMTSSMTNHSMSKDPTVFVEIYGCQMNVNDAEIVYAILKESGYRRADHVDDANIVLLMTCAIRENAEHKIWQRLHGLQLRKRTTPNFRLGVLGCMAERLKQKILEVEKSVDIVCGPDAYRDLPRLLSTVENGDSNAMNVMLSLEETYADITPLRINQDGVSAFVSIMRGCDNMCSYCIVPFTRGRERSRPIESILQEVQYLRDQGVKEIILLGQNVNSYHDTSTETVIPSSIIEPSIQPSPSLSRGFKTIYKRKRHEGQRFADLLDRVASIDSGIRFRFTSPHPKDFPDELLEVIRSHDNLCKSIHLPAQSGSSRVLETMRRGYTREAYLDLVRHIRDRIPAITLSSDFISGFCGETEEDHQETVSLLREVKYEMAYMFAYSMREKTHAHHHYIDDVPDDVKQRRLAEIIQVFRELVKSKNEAYIGTDQLVLIEGPSKRSGNHLVGRTDGNLKCVFPDIPVEDKDTDHESTATQKPLIGLKKGDYIRVHIQAATAGTLLGTPLERTSLKKFFRKVDEESVEMLYPIPAEA